MSTGVISDTVGVPILLREWSLFTAGAVDKGGGHKI